MRALASRTLRGLIAKYDLVYVDASAIADNAFFGAHLLSEKDAAEGLPAGDSVYSRYSTQSQYYLNQTLASNLAVVYVASGHTSEVASGCLRIAPWDPRGHEIRRLICH